jgi:hypothetical protein
MSGQRFGELQVFAEETSKPRTRADIVETNAIASFTVSFESGLIWSCGKERRRSKPANAPPNTDANTIKLIAAELMVSFPKP